MHIDLKRSMETNFQEIENFFSGIQINGNLDERAKCVVEFIERSSGGIRDRHFCVAISPNAEMYLNVFVVKFGTEKNLQAGKFENNGTDFMIGKLSEFGKIRNFKDRVVCAIDEAEATSMYDSLKEKARVFGKVFGRDVNLLLVRGKEHLSGVYVRNVKDNFYSEARGDVKYVAWI